MQANRVLRELATRLLFIALPLCLFASSAVARDWRITDFNDTIVISENGSTSVHERITLEFNGAWHGIHRTIPIEYPGPNGTNYTLFVDVKSVTDGSGNKLKYESSTSHGSRDLKIYIPDAVDATRSVEIDYIVRNAIRYFDDHDEFYWNVTGNDWPVPIDHAAATVSLPSSAAGSLRAQAFTGVYGSAERGATAQVNGSEVRFETNNPLPMRGGMTIDIFIPKGILKQPSAFTRLMWFLGSNPVVFVPFFTLAVMFTLWWYKGRDPDPGLSVAPMYSPPTGMTPAETGTLLEDEIHPRDITSTIVDLAVRGYLKIEEVSETTLAIFHHKDYLFHLQQPRRDWHGLAPHERVILENIFGQDEQTRLSALKNRFYLALPAVKQDIMAALKNKGMYSVDPDSANGYSIGAAVAIVAPLIALEATGYVDLLNSVPLALVCGIISAIIWWLFARQMTAKTKKGVQTRVTVLGFQEFMNRVDADRLKQMPPDTFEKYLAYAMALGVEHHWAQAFSGLITSPPSWYVAPGGYYGPGMGFNPILFSSSMHSMASDMNQVFVSAPRASSSGSGFGGGGGGGGGFSGGGFGGGGGGAF
ncbi:MAG: conserved rane protein of unknown function [Acidobacteriaceae bacterium]|jgi:uncharacterized membrane protein|nr:conserved rane protein of unknown function [Acidobacteriaceae bacterium]